ncbi:F-box domain-containing protein [Mycena chlorophos]|uniref:F-box domain-containing protein n=1 Tax=Mycena chlorophos TaxID=658473 RepID=A0A8H6S8R2_MYCCL|nr:F-box domain-containing protein [Mycena chlorophos]
MSLASLPLELILEIFQLCVPRNPSKLDLVLSPTHAPLLLAQICSSWRRIVLSAPILWTDFHVDCNSAGRTRHIGDLMRLWLSRSGTFPLDIALRGNICRRGPIPSQLDRVFVTLKEHASHVRSLHLCVTGVDLLELEACRMTFPVLEQLDIHVVNGEQSESNLPAGTWPFMENSFLDSRIRRLDLTLPLSYLKTPYAGVTFLEVQGYDLAQALYALANLPALTEFVFMADVGFGWELPDADAAPLLHPTLRSLNVAAMLPSEKAAPFFQSLTLPSLEHLAIEPSDFAPSTLEAFLDRSSAHLKKLELMPGTAQHLTSVYGLTNGAFQTLEELRIGRPEESGFEAFCEALGEDKSFLPNLRKLVVGCDERDPGVPTLYGDAIIELLGPALEDRMVATGPLRSLQIVWEMGYNDDVELFGGIELDDEILEPLQRLKEGGTEVFFEDVLWNTMAELKLCVCVLKLANLTPVLI